VATALAAVLRLDAITQAYGAVERPAWLHATQSGLNRTMGALRPAGLVWNRVGTYPHRDGPPTQYLSDPYTYLIFARDMRSFYQAHHREPVFPFVTRVWLWLLSNQDVAVSFTSASFSVLLVLATYWLGELLWSRWVGFGAALALAIEYDVITWAIGGWRDDAFACGVVACACASLVFLRNPSANAAIFLGVCGGLTCLTRLTAVTFLVPMLAGLLVSGSERFRNRARGVGLALGVGLVVVGPYVINCWIAYGDPLYAINHLTADQLVMEAGQQGAGASPQPSSTTAAGYLFAKVAGRPFQTLETIVLGLSSYPFSNKWVGFDRWIPYVGRLLSWAALAGLILLTTSARGRLVLLLLVTSLAPAALTWRLAADWRFTAHAYPVFLVAAFGTFAAVVTLARRSRIDQDLTRTRVGIAVATAIGATAIFWFVMRPLPFLVVSESLRTHQDVTIGLARASGFFLEGWSTPVAAGNVTLRTAIGETSSIQFPLPIQDDYLLTVRLDPSPRPNASQMPALPVVRVFMNNAPVSTFELTWNPERVGAYSIHVPPTAVRRGTNRLTFMTGAPGPGASEAPRTFVLWYLRISRTR
jgi:hypothetical protein